MTRKEPTMYAEKQFELETMKDRLVELFESDRYPVIKFREQVFYEFGKSKTLLLVFERGIIRARDYDKITLVILLTEYGGCQGADVLVNPWIEDQMVNACLEALKNLGFKEGQLKPRFIP